MALRLPVLVSVDRSTVIEPFTIPDPDASPVQLRYGAHPGDPAPQIRCVPYGLTGPNILSRLRGR